MGGSRGEARWPQTSRRADVWNTPWADSGWPGLQVEIERAAWGAKERRILKTPSGALERTASTGSEHLMPGGIQVDAGQTLGRGGGGVDSKAPEGTI